MGSVYLVAHPRLPRNDALKLLSADLSNDPEFRARFEREADIAAGMRHPNIVAVYDRGTEGNQLWIAMEYVEGRDVAELIKAGPQVLTPTRAVNIIRDVAKALDYAHRSGLLHRDVKPANILVTAGVDEVGSEKAVITDFGIAKPISAATELTAVGSFLATPDYASPEQFAGQHLDHRSDIYALGCTLFEMLTGGKPFSQKTILAMINAHVNAPPPQVTARMPQLPRAIDAVIARAMAKDPNQRYNTCRELADDAARAFNMATTSGPLQFAPSQKTPTQRSRRKAIAVVAGVVAVVAAVGVGIAVAVNSGGGTAGTANSTTAVTTTPRPSGEVAESTDGTFEVSVPDLWRAVEEEGYLVKLESASSSSNANLLVSINEEADLNQSIDEAAESNVAQVRGLNGVTVDSGGIEATSVDGEQARRFTYSVSAESNNGVEARGRQLYTRHKGVEYIVTFTGDKQSFNAAVAQFDEVLRSWTWLS